MKFVIHFVLVFFVFQNNCYSQQSKAELTKKFAITIKSVDDFFDRFNFKEKTNFRNFLITEFPDNNITREKLLYTLFNAKSKYCSDIDKKDFVNEVIKESYPQYINYKDTNWYAALDCSVLLNGKPEKLLLVLNVESKINDGFEWSITAAHSSFLDGSLGEIDATLFSEFKNKNILSDEKKYFLSPISHGIDFTNLDNIFTNKNHFKNYISKDIASSELIKLNNLITNSKIKFRQVESISYHLLQIDGWVLVLNHIENKDYANGWLVNQLIKTTENEKRIYKQKSLHIKLQ